MAELMNEARFSQCAYETVKDSPKNIAREITGQLMCLPVRPQKFIVERVCEGIRIRVVLEIGDRGILAVYPLDF